MFSVRTSLRFCGWLPHGLLTLGGTTGGFISRSYRLQSSRRLWFIHSPLLVCCLSSSGPSLFSPVVVGETLLLSPTDLPDIPANGKLPQKGLQHLLHVHSRILSPFFPSTWAYPLLTTSPLDFCGYFLFVFFCFAPAFIHHHLNWKPHSGLIFWLWSWTLLWFFLQVSFLFLVLTTSLQQRLAWVLHGLPGPWWPLFSTRQESDMRHFK